MLKPSAHLFQNRFQPFFWNRICFSLPSAAHAFRTMSALWALHVFLEAFWAFLRFSFPPFSYLLFAAVCFPPTVIHRPILRVSFAAERHSQVPFLADVRWMSRDGCGEFLIFLRLASPRFRRLLWPSGFWGVGAVPASHAYGYGPGGTQVFCFPEFFVFQCFYFPGPIFP